jgi:hypothetical protein
MKKKKTMHIQRKYSKKYINIRSLLKAYQSPAAVFVLVSCRIDEYLTEPLQPTFK